MAEAAFERARAVVASVTSAPFVLPAYTGGPDDLPYLRTWALDVISTYYGVPEYEFDEPNLFSASIVRDFVHRALLQNAYPLIFDVTLLFGDFEAGMGFRYPATGFCALVAGQMFWLCKALGWPVRHGDIIGDGNLSGWGGSHVVTVIWHLDAQKWIFQDSYENYVPRNAAGAPLSWAEARDEIFFGSGHITFDNFKWYTNWQSTGVGLAVIPADVREGIERALYSIPYTVMDTHSQRMFAPSIFKDAPTARVAASNQGLTFASLAAAQAAIDPLRTLGLHWSAIAAYFQGRGFYMAGIAERRRLDRWVSFRLADWTYRTINLFDDRVFVGGLDDAANIGTFHSDFHLLAWNGLMWPGWSDLPAIPYDAKTLLLRDVASGRVRLAELMPDLDIVAGMIGGERAYHVVGVGPITDADAEDILCRASNGDVVLSGAWSTVLGSKPAPWFGELRDVLDAGVVNPVWRNPATGTIVYWTIAGGVATEHALSFTADSEEITADSTVITADAS